MSNIVDRADMFSSTGAPYRTLPSTEFCKIHESARFIYPRLSAFLERFTYKPGYQFTLVADYQASEINGLRLHYGRPPAKLSLKCYLPDSTRPPHRDTLIQFMVLVMPHLEDEQEALMQGWLRSVLQEFEMHELDEWFKLDGKCARNPHG